MVEPKEHGVVSDLRPPWTVACQVPLSMGSSRQEYWSRLPFPSPWNLLDPGIEAGSPALQADSLPTELRGKLKEHGRPIHISRREATRGRNHTRDCFQLWGLGSKVCC